MGHTYVTNLPKLMPNTPNLDLVNINTYAFFPHTTELETCINC